MPINPENINVDNILHGLKDFGRFQVLQYVVISCMQIPNAFNLLAIVFIGKFIYFYFHFPAFVSDSYFLGNASFSYVYIYIFFIVLYIMKSNPFHEQCVCECCLCNVQMTRLVWKIMMLFVLSQDTRLHYSFLFRMPDTFIKISIYLSVFNKTNLKSHQIISAFTCVCGRTSERCACKCKLTSVTFWSNLFFNSLFVS